LPYHAKRAKTNADTAFSEVYSEPFVKGEFLAVRDEPHGPFYIALVLEVTATSLRVHYYGISIVLAAAVLKPCWNEVNGSAIVLLNDCPLAANYGLRNFEPYI
jgi:hypothetical protein